MMNGIVKPRQLFFLLYISTSLLYHLKLIKHGRLIYWNWSIAFFII